MLDKKSKTMRTAGAWSITMGITCLVVGVAVGVGCIVTGGCLLGGSKKYCDAGGLGAARLTVGRCGVFNHPRGTVHFAIYKTQVRNQAYV